MSLSKCQSAKYSFIAKWFYDKCDLEFDFQRKEYMKQLEITSSRMKKIYPILLNSNYLIW